MLNIYQSTAVILGFLVTEYLFMSILEKKTDEYFSMNYHKLRRRKIISGEKIHILGR